VCLLGGATSAYAAKPARHAKLDRKLNDRASTVGTSRVIVLSKPGATADAGATKLGGKLGRRLGLINGRVVELSNMKLTALADHPAVARIVHDRPTGGELNRVAITVGARAVQQTLGYTGAGVGVAVIDSGVTPWHDDLTSDGFSSAVKTDNAQRVAAFVDFVNNRTSPYDDNGHGTHVSGIVAGNGYDTFGARAGIAPAAHLVSLKVLDAQGRGVISDVIAALDWAVANKTQHNIRVINLSVGAAVTESYNVDPLTLAAKRAVDAGIVVVTAAGNLGKNRLGQSQYGGITAPGNAPWVLTVGASNHEGTIARTDDTIAGYSSRGPSAIDYQAKPDLVAPGTGVVSLSDPASLMYITKASSLLKGTLLFGQKPYLSLTGTSMSAPVVAGSVALMIEANPNLTPNLVKAILQYTAQEYAGYNALTQGAGFLNTKGAVDLARFFATARAGERYPTNKAWSKKLLWGNQRVSKGVIKPYAPAWKLGVDWGAAEGVDGANIVWGVYCGDVCANMLWDTDREDNIVWGTGLNTLWGAFRVVGGELDEDNIVWGTMLDEDNVVWGTDCSGADCTGVVWGACFSFRLQDAFNIVWGTSLVMWDSDGVSDNVVWGTSSEEDNVTWGNSGEDAAPFDDPDAEPVIFDASVWEDLFGPAVLDPLPVVEPLAPVLEPLAPVLAPLAPALLTPLAGVIGGI
jgi:serine protease AprX